MRGDNPSDRDAVVDIEMFTGPGCAYCAQSRSLLEAHGLDFVEYDVSDPAHLDEYRRRMPRLTTLPQIFIGGEHIGSFEDLQILATTDALGP